MDNAEINNIIKILGLHFKEKYDSVEKLRTLRYGRLMIMTDQDQDGSHIKGLLVNFVHHFWPNLLQHNFVEEFITPIVKVTIKQMEGGSDLVVFYQIQFLPFFLIETILSSLEVDNSCVYVYISFS